MSWEWLIGAVVVWLVSAACIIGTMYELAVGKTDLRKGDFWGGVAFHGATAILALWLFLMALGKE
ncbi:hypothetical protein ACFL2Q_16870 [Thermodesulfobacteriota bacterium]